MSTRGSSKLRPRRQRGSDCKAMGPEEKGSESDMAQCRSPKVFGKGYVGFPAGIVGIVMMTGPAEPGDGGGQTPAVSYAYQNGGQSINTPIRRMPSAPVIIVVVHLAGRSPRPPLGASMARGS